MPPSFAAACRRTCAAIGLALIAAFLVLPSAALAAQHLGERTLQEGDSGHDVRVLQDFLTRDGYRTPIVGRFGPETLRNVKRFEQAHHLTVDGVVGPAVVKALRAVAARKASARPHGATRSQHLGDRVLKRGMHGHDVRVLQDFLTRAGFATPIVGQFGPTTLATV